MKKDRRVTITIKLRPDRDHDLIRWYQSLRAGTSNERGGKNETLVALLKGLLFEGDCQVTESHQQQSNDFQMILYEQQQVLNELQTRIRELEKRPAIGIAHNPDFVEKDTQTIRREQRLKRMNW